MPHVTYVVPMTPVASAAQVAMMQNRQQMQEHTKQAVDDAHDKAYTAFEMAAEAQEQLSMNLLQNQGMMYLIIAVFIIILIFLMR